MAKVKVKNRSSRAEIVGSLQLKLNQNKIPKRLLDEGVEYDTSKLIVLAQMRKLFEQEELQIFGRQLKFLQLHPVTIRRCTETEFRDHLKLARKLFPYAVIPRFASFKDKQREDGTYDVLIAGERRLRGLRTTPDWDGKICAFVYTRLTSHMAFFLQQAENTAKIPEREEEADMVGRLYHLAKEKEHKVTLAELSILINRSPSYTSDLVRFSGLPDYIQWFFEKKLLSYSNCIQVGRLEGIFKQERIKNEILHIISSRMNTENTRKYIQKLLEEVSTPNLFGDDFQAELEKAFSNTRRKVVGQQLAGVVSRDRKYVEVVARLLSLNLIGKGKAYSEESPRRQLGLFANDLLQMVPVIKELYNDSLEFEKLDDSAKTAIREVIAISQ
jgi:hypothetical protein